MTVVPITGSCHDDTMWRLKALGVLAGLAVVYAMVTVIALALGCGMIIISMPLRLWRPRRMTLPVA